MTSAPLFELADVSLEIDGTIILDHVDLAIADGGITVLVGPSGAGKSTVLRLLDRLEVPTAGEVRFRGRPMAELDVLALRRRVGMVFQRPAPFPGTVRDNLHVADPDAVRGRAGRRPARRPARRRLPRPPGRRAVGRRGSAHVPGPHARHPARGAADGRADVGARHRCPRRLERTALRLADEGHDLVWVTHDLDQVQRLGGDIVVLVEGRIAGADARARFLAGEWSTDDPADDLTDDLTDEPSGARSDEPSGARSDERAGARDRDERGDDG